MMRESSINNENNNNKNQNDEYECLERKRM